MVRVSVSNNNQRGITVIMDSNATLAQAFEEAGVSTANATISLDGRPMTNPNVTFADCGVAESCELWAIIKQHNA